MRRRLVAALLLVLCFAALTARAGPFTTYFLAVQGRVVAMRDALVPPLTRAEGKRKALLEEILAALDVASPSLEQDLETARTVALAAVSSLRDDPELPGIVRTLLQNLAGDLAVRVDSLAARLAALTDPKAPTKAEKSLAGLRASLVAFDKAAARANLKSMAAALFKAAKGAGALEKLVAKAETDAAATAAGCGDVPIRGAKLAVSLGAPDPLVLQSTTAVKSSGGAGRTIVGTSDLLPSGLFVSVTVSFPVDSASLRAGTEPVATVTCGVGIFTSPQQYAADVPVLVVEAGPKRVVLCIDVVLPVVESGALPAQVTVKGYLVITR